GTSTTERGAIRIGNRYSRPAVASVGAAMLALTLCGGAIIAWGSIRGTGYHSRYPEGLLLAESRWGGAAGRQSAFAELNARFQQSRLSRQTVWKAISIGLELQAQQDRTWCPEA